MAELNSTIELTSALAPNCSPYDSFSYAVVAGVSAGLAFLSLLLMLPVIGILLLFKKWRFFGQRLFLYMAFSSMLFNVATILHRVDYHNQTSDFYRRFCEFGGYLDQVSSWMVLVSISAITFYCSLLLFLDKRTEKYELVYVFLIFVFPFLFTWVPFIKDSYGRSGAWCWIRSEDRDDCSPHVFGQWLQFTIWFIPLYLTMVVLIVLYVMIVAKLYSSKMRNSDQQNMVKMRGELIPLISYPLIYFLINILPFINRAYNSANTEPSLALWYLAAIANPSMGAWLALAYVLTPGTRKRLKMAEVRAAWRELCGGGGKVVKEYDLEKDKETSVQTDSFRSAEAHPYRNYEDCYRLNMSNSKTT